MRSKIICPEDTQIKLFGTRKLGTEHDLIKTILTVRHSGGMLGECISITGTWKLVLYRDWDWETSHEACNIIHKQMCTLTKY